MCISFFVVGDSSAPVKFILGGNRDEFFDRESVELGPWPDAPHIFAGRDLVRGGTWLGMAQKSRDSLKFAVVHNYRHHGPVLQHSQSRGALVLDFLKGGHSAEEWAAHVTRQAARYNGFTLILVDRHDAYFVTNRPIAMKRLAPGVYGLCNASLDTPWPKLVAGKQKFRRLLSSAKGFGSAGALARAVIDLVLKDTTRFPDELPGVLDRDKEVGLSSIFVEPYEWDQSGLYGTRTHSVVLMGDEGFHFAEETLDPKTMRWKFSEVSKGRVELPRARL